MHEAPARGFGVTLRGMTALDLSSLRLRPGEVRHERLEIELDPYVLGGQRYEPLPYAVPAELEITEVSGGMSFRVTVSAHLSGPCMRCLGHADVELALTAREFHDPDADPGDERRSDYVVDDRLELSAWARDAIALELPEQILCRPDCAGLCPICGKDLNLEPHEHVEQELDPRWSALESLRDQL
jgi:uncharacterized protein